VRRAQEQPLWRAAARAVAVAEHADECAAAKRQQRAGAVRQRKLDGARTAAAAATSVIALG